MLSDGEERTHGPTKNNILVQVSKILLSIISFYGETHQFRKKEGKTKSSNLFDSCNYVFYSVKCDGKRPHFKVEV